MDGLRPEYIDAVDAARSNGWLVPLFLAAPVTLTICVVKQLRQEWLAAPVLASMFATWISLYLYSEHIWQTKEMHAVTEAEWDDVTADTARLFGPILIGVPLSVAYTLAWLTIIAMANWVIRRKGRLFHGPPREVDASDRDFESYRQSLVEEYTRRRGECSRRQG